MTCAAVCEISALEWVFDLHHRHPGTSIWHWSLANGHGMMLKAGAALALDVISKLIHYPDHPQYYTYKASILAAEE